MRIRAVGPDALLVELDDAASVATTYASIRRLIADDAVVPPRDVVPGARTVLIDGVAAEEGAAFDRWRTALAQTTDSAPAPPAAESSRETALGIRYDGADLDLVAAQWGCSPATVIGRHQAATFTVAFCGFAPGFAYCTSDPALPPVRRRADPRTAVPAGSVALAGEYCGIYPRTMPGGWQLIGHTDALLFDPDRDEPATLRPGDTVRFVAHS